jgi:co-chaperonin GroES (HSP10)
MKKAKNEINDDINMDSTTINQAIKARKKSIYHVNPIGMRILVRIPDENSLTDGGLYLPESAKDNLNDSVIAEVVEVASAHDQDNDEDTNVSGIPKGSNVLISKKVGMTVPWDNSMRIVDTKDVLAIINKIELT